MIDLDRPPVPERALPDPERLRYATLIAARHATRRPVRATRRLALVLVATALLAATLFGVLSTVVPMPEVAGPPTVPLPEGAVSTDRGPASEVEIDTALSGCVPSEDFAPLSRVLSARRVAEGDVVGTAVVAELTDRTVVSCRVPSTDGVFTDLGGPGGRTEPSVIFPAVDAGTGPGSTLVEGRDVTYRTEAIVAAISTVRTVDAVVELPDGSRPRFRGEVHDGWVVIPITVHFRVPRADVYDTPDPTIDLAAYDLSGKRVAVRPQLG